MATTSRPWLNAWLRDGLQVPAQLCALCRGGVMTHPARYHRIDLSMTPTEASEAFSVPHSIAVNLLKNKRNLCGVTRDELLREQIEPLIMRHGVTIDECAEKFNLTSERVCKIMGWM